MSPAASKHFSRRSFLQVTGVGVTTQTLLAPNGGMEAARAAELGRTSPASLRIAGVATTAVFAPGGQSRIETDFPSLIDIDVESHEELVIRCDERVWSVSERAVAEDRLGRSHIIAGRVNNDGSTTFALNPDYVRLAPQARVSATYPSDLVDDVTATEVSVGDLRHVFDVRTTSLQAWGAEVAVAWVLTGGQYIPAIVTVTSVGPGDLPAGLEIEYSLPQPAMEEILETPDAARQSVDGSGPSSRTQIRAAVPGGVTPGSSFELTFSVSEETAGRPDVSQRPYASLLIPEPSRSGARATGLYASAPVSPSGSALTDFNRVETA